jgi:hypothetical protein
MISSKLAILAASIGFVCTLGCSDLANVQSAYDRRAGAAKQPPDVTADELAQDKNAPTCGLSMQLLNRSDSGQLRMISERVCIEGSDHQLALPSKLKLWVNDNGSYSRYHVCRDGTDKATHADPNVITCEWNGIFRHTWPWTIVLSTNGAALKTQIQGVRAFRNGALVWIWVPKPSDTLAELTVPGRDLKGTLMPEDAPLDLRIIPSGVTVDAAVLAAKVQARPSQWATQSKVIENAILTSPSLANGKLKDEVTCLEYRVAMVRYHAAQIAGSTTTLPVAPVDCKDVPQDSTPDGLRQRYEQLKQDASQDVDATEQKFVDDVNAYRTKLSASENQALTTFQQALRDFWAGQGAWWADLQTNGKANSDTDRAAYLKLLDDTQARRAIIEGNPKDAWAKLAKAVKTPTEAELVWLKTRGTPEELQFLISQTDALLTQGLQAVDDTIALAGELKKDAIRIVGSRDEQAQLFLRAANALQTVSPLQAITPNPDLLPGERALAMRYSDPWQFFFVAPWTGFPVSVGGDADFSGANLIPIVDAMGWRYQFSGSRLADVRAGIGLTALSFTSKEDSTDPATGVTSKKDVQQFRFTPEANFGFGNLKLGVGYAMGGDSLSSKERVRVLVGADLYKLISGNNLELGTQ